MILTIPTKAVCEECGRIFHLLHQDEVNEWLYGHDCEE